MTQKTEKELYEMLDNFRIHIDTQESDTMYMKHSDMSILVGNIVEIVNRNSSIVQVEDFMTTFEQKVRKNPEIPTKEECEFRLELCTEELIEVAEACGSDVLSAYGRKLFHKSQEIHYKVENGRESIKPDLVKLFDGLEDSQYVLDGFKITCGLQNISEEGQLEVHTSNMSKVCVGLKDLEDTLLKYEKEGIVVEGQGIGQTMMYLVRRNTDKKVLKSINYKPANLSRILLPQV